MFQQLQNINQQMSGLLVGKMPDQLPWQVATDTRGATENLIFWCLSGEKFDAFDFIESLEKKLPALVVYQSSEIKNAKAKVLAQKWNIPFLGLSDTFQAFQLASKMKCQAMIEKGSKVIAITGANGKTTTKELLSALIEKVYQVPIWKTRANNNNHIGVPLTILESPIESKFLILEFGSNHPGEMQNLCNSTTLTHALTTNIGDAHLEFFETQEKVFLEETLVHKFIDQTKGFWMGHEEDIWLQKLAQAPVAVMIPRCKYSNSTLTYPWSGEEVRLVNNSLIGRHNLLNLAMAVCFISAHSPELKDKAITAASEIGLPSLNRSELKMLGETQLFMDAYNANPSSMRSSLDGFMDWLEQNKILLDKVLFILGDMYELGSVTEEKHRELGRYLESRGVKNACFVGKYFKYYMEEFKQGKGFTSALEYRPEFQANYSRFQAVFVKGSRGVGLEKIL